MNTIDKLNNVYGWLTAMNFDKPELSKDLEEPLNVLSEAISEVKNLTIPDDVGLSEQLKCRCTKTEKYYDTIGDIERCQICEKPINIGLLCDDC